MPCELGRNAAADAGAQVLTLGEAAAFLQLGPDDLAAAAQRGEVPGRRLLDQWRFSRAALIAWLAGADQPAECFDRRFAETGPTPVPAPKPAPSRAWVAPELAERDLGAVMGTGTGASGTTVAQADPPQPPADQQDEPAPDSFGEEPDLDTARDIALREQTVLLRRGELTLETGLFYSRSDEEQPVLTPGGFFPAQVNQEAFTATLTARYGVIDDLQLVASVPFSHQTTERDGPGVTDESSESEFGDVSLSTRYGLLAEGPRWPSVILSADSRIPTDGSEAFAIGGGFSLVKSLDPTALFASASYLHTFNADSRDLDDLEAEDTLSASLGFAFAMNDRLSFSTALIGVFNPSSELGQIVLPSDENYNLRLALTSLLAENLYLEPSVSFRLNGPADAVTFGLSLPYTFAP